MPSLTPAERSLRASIAANTRWANTSVIDRRRQADAGQAALRQRFANQIDPTGTLSPDELERRIDNAIKAHMQRLALKSSRARRGQAA